MSRSDAFIVVECDDINCEERVEIQLTALAMRGNWDERGVDRQLARMGWTKRGEDDICDTCSEEAEERA